MTTSEDLTIARDAMSHVPLLAKISASDGDITRLGGLTNLVYRIAATDGPYCLRVPGKGTEEYIDRDVEKVNSLAAARAGVSPELLHFGDDGIMVTRFLDGCETMSPLALQSLSGAPSRAARAFHKLHSSGETFSFRFDLFSMIDGYLAHLDKLGVTEFPEGYHEAVRDAEAVREALNAHELPLAACHCDPMCENMLDDGERMWIVDWEYSGMNDPLWDLGDFSVEAGFGPEHDREMLEAYFGGPAAPDQVGRMILYKAMCDLLWTLWGLIQHANDNPAEDFWEYATTRFARCRALMDDASFASHVEAVRKGA
jgi:thiamine kinase-like enzyme